MPLGFVPDTLVFHENGSTRAVAGTDHGSFVEPLTRKTLTTLDEIQSPFTMNFDQAGCNLFIAEHDTGRTHVWRAHDTWWSQVQLGDGGPVGAITLSPDPRLAMVSQHQNKSVHVWGLYMDQHFATIPMSASAIRTYVSADSMNMILVGQDGQGTVVNT